MDWQKHKSHWPLAQHSVFINSPPIRWHVQKMGSGPVMLLLHGAGATTQSWRHLMPILAKKFSVIALDLPGQGFSASSAPRRFGLRSMAQDIADLCAQEGWQIDYILGHSAGSAIALELCQHAMTPKAIIGLNAALSPFGGFAGWMFPAMAKLLSITPGFSGLFARLNNSPGAVSALLSATGSRVDAQGRRLYRDLISDSAHVAGTLQMMAHWDVAPLWSAMAHINIPVILMTGARDKTVPPHVSRDAVKELPNGEWHDLGPLGHLAHEEDPQKVADFVLQYCCGSDVLSGKLNKPHSE